MRKHFYFIQSIWWNFLGHIHANEIASETLYKWRGIASLLIFTYIFFSTVFFSEIHFLFYCWCSHAEQKCRRTTIFSIFINNFYSWQKQHHECKRWVRRAGSYCISRRMKKSRSNWENSHNNYFFIINCIKSNKCTKYERVRRARIHAQSTDASHCSQYWNTE